MRSTHSSLAGTAPVLPADAMALVSMALVQPIVGLKKSAVHDRIKEKRFPAPLRLSTRCARFRAGDIREYLRDPLGWTPDKALDSPKHESGERMSKGTASTQLVSCEAKDCDHAQVEDRFVGAVKQEGGGE